MPPTFKSPPQPANVLVVDDDPVMREVLSVLLPGDGYTVRAVESGEAALAELQQGIPADVVLTDVQLPGVTGPELAAQLRRASPGVVLVAMSGSEPGTEVRAAFDAFLLKPFTTEDFNSAVSGGRGSHGKGLASAVPAPAKAFDEATYERLAKSMRPVQLAELYKLTLDDADARIQNLGEFYAHGDEDNWRREAHALKGGCSMVGATELASLAARAERVAFSDTPHPGDFTAAAERLRSNLTARFSGIT